MRELVKQTELNSLSLSQCLTPLGRPPSLIPSETQTPVNYPPQDTKPYRHSSSHQLGSFSFNLLFSDCSKGESAMMMMMMMKLRWYCMSKFRTFSVSRTQTHWRWQQWTRYANRFVFKVGVWLMKMEFDEDFLRLPLFVFISWFSTTLLCSCWICTHSRRTFKVCLWFIIGPGMSALYMSSHGYTFANMHTLAFFRCFVRSFVFHVEHKHSSFLGLDWSRDGWASLWGSCLGLWWLFRSLILS